MPSENMNEQKIVTAPNTDNKINRFVTFFVGKLLQKMRHASLIKVVGHDTTPMTLLWSQPPFAQQHLLILLPGR
jgi:hypothetical protein